MEHRPAIVLVDDDPRELAALSDAVTRRFGNDYRVLSHSSARAALEEVSRVAAQGQELALVVADQWMSETTGSDLLGQVRALCPTTKRALLVGWGDRSASGAILRGCAFGKLDNYILKPWTPPEVHLYPSIGEFLAEWTRAFRPKTELVRIVGEAFSRRSHELRELMERSGIEFGFYAADSERGRQLLAEKGLSEAPLPVVIFLDGRALPNPTNVEVADALGVTSLKRRDYDVAIVGAGPAGLAAAVYTASEGLDTVVLERETIGGQAGTSSLIRNYLGFPKGISGAELAQRAYQQAWLFGAKFVFGRDVAELSVRGPHRVLTLDDGVEITVRAVIIASGARYRRLEVPSLERFTGAGLFYTAMSDTLLIADRDVYVIGGGNSAGQAVVHAAESARHVTLLVRGASLAASMSDYLVQQISRLENVDVLLNTEVVGGTGRTTLERITLLDRNSSTKRELPVDVLYVMIGAVPHTTWLAGTVERDSHGFILTGADVARNAGHQAARFETSLPGVFAIGDVRSGSIKRVASAVGEGSAAVMYVHEYLERMPPLRPAESARDDLQPSP